MRRAQRHALEARFNHDTMCVDNCKKMYICSHCAIKRGGLNAMCMRYDCNTGRYGCVHCGPTPVLVLDMLGKIANVTGEYIVLSSCCATLIHYTGSGMEFCTKCGPQCHRHQHVHKKKDKIVCRKAPPAACCVQCGNTHVVQTFHIINAYERCMMVRATCSRHRVPAHLLAAIKDDDGLRMALKSCYGGA